VHTSGGKRRHLFPGDRNVAQRTGGKGWIKLVDSGWSGSAQTYAAAKVRTAGGAYSGAVEVAPGVWVYQITKNGIALQLTLQGTKYYEDDDLNKK